MKKNQGKSTFKSIRLLMCVLTALALAVISGYYLSNATMSLSQYAVYNTPELRAGAIDRGVDLTLMSAPMYHRFPAEIMVAVVAASIIFLTIIFVNKCTVTLTFYAFGTLITMAATFFLSLAGTAGFAEYSAQYLRYCILYGAATFCGALFIAAIVLASKVQRYRYYVRKGKMPDWDELDDSIAEDSAPLSEAALEAQPS